MAELEDHSPITPKLIDSLYTEAMLLADEARSYFDKNGRDERMSLDPLVRVGFSCESLKVTTRLMHVIAWLLTQRAVHVGEISALEATSPNRQLGEAPETDEALLNRLPPKAVKLILSSRDLYERVKRVSEPPPAESRRQSPARSLLRRLERSL